jgi:hypothetical protein
MVFDKNTKNEYSILRASCKELCVMFRFVFVLSIFLFPLSALPEVRTFPEALVGEWVRPSNNEHGDINIVITKKVENTIHGVMTLTGSSYCTEPIPFKGNGSGDTAFISGDAKIICGYGGKLTGQVTRVSDNFYTGNFAYFIMAIPCGLFVISYKD